MNSFTRSLFYSTAVIVLGLGAVIAIYSDSQTSLSAIEPAAGIEKTTDMMQDPALDQTSFTSDLPAPSAAETQALIDQADANAKSILAEIESIMQAAEEMDKITPAAGHEEHGDEHDEDHGDEHDEDHGDEHDEDHGDEHH